MDTVFAMEYDGQRLCVDVYFTILIPTLGLPLPSNPVQANGTIKHPKPGALAAIKEQGKQKTGELLLQGTDLKYIPAAVTDLGHQGEGMGKALNHLAGCKYGPVIGANRARAVKFLFHKSRAGSTDHTPACYPETRLIWFVKQKFYTHAGWFTYIFTFRGHLAINIYIIILYINQVMDF